MRMNNVNFSLLNQVSYNKSINYKGSSNRGPVEKVNNSLNFNDSCCSENAQFSSLYLELNSADGDRISLSIESLQLKKNVGLINGVSEKKNIEHIFTFVKDQVSKMRDELAKLMEKKGIKSIPENEDTSSQNDIVIPEYWNAQNTSQRIIEFSFSFYAKFEGSIDEFSSTIRSAIDDGFSQAKKILGNISENINDLIGETYDLVMEKLDSLVNEKKTQKIETV